MLQVAREPTVGGNELHQGGKSKGKDGGKGKGEDVGKGFGSYQGYCHWCGMWGHTAKFLQAKRHLHGRAAEVVVSKCVSC